MAEFPSPRPHLASVEPYNPPEQTRYSLTKLNANENPYPPAVEVIDAISTASERKIRLYPEPTCAELRQAIATSLRIKPRQVICGNGSDELLRQLAEVYVSPGEKIASLWPSYPYYRAIAAACGAEFIPLHWRESSQELAIESAPGDCKLIYIANPNPPIGFPVEVSVIETLARNHPGTLIVIDEAYCAFSGATALRLVRAGIPNIVVTRSFTKSHSLGGLRLGFAMGAEEVLAPLWRIRDPHNVGALVQIAGLAAWKANDWLTDTLARINDTRSRIRMELIARRYDVPASAGNFLFIRGGETSRLVGELRERNLLVKSFIEPELRDGFGVSVGTDEEMDQLLGALDALLDYSPSRSGVMKMPSREELSQ